ncbi:thiamine diphosphate-binding protein [Aspergillus desertorum]
MTVFLVNGSSSQHDIVLKTFRLLIADLCQQFGGGHPGNRSRALALCHAIRPHTPDFFNRDRFVLSNGHTCLFQYTFFHLTGYKAMTFEQLKSYHSGREDALCPGHPEIEHEGIEVTTGPLGQGVANAVGLAMATKNLAATYNRPGYEVVNNHTWCMIGDACLQEGVALEAISLAGHWKLNNLTIILRACGWDVIDVEDGCYDVEGIVEALSKARASTEKPTFINNRTVIGLGSKVAGQAAAHGVAFGAEDVAAMKRKLGFNPGEHFVIGETVREFFADLPARGEGYVREWKELVQRYAKAHPELAEEFQRRVRGELPADWQKLIRSINSFMVGTADLSPSVNMIWKGKPNLRTTCGINGNYSGRYIHYGVREHAMAAISNGLAAFNPNTFMPITSSFFMFYLPATPQVIHAATHDYIGMGKGGPTHQPIELASLYRAMPNLLFIRPGDSEETAGAWIAAINAKKSSTIISTSRHTLPQLKQTSRDSVLKGAYVLEEAPNANVTLIGVGAELSFALDVATQLKEKKGIAAWVVSFPCQRLFEQQPLEYRRGVLQQHKGIPAVVIEPYAPNGWERYADAGISVKRFGHSLPGKAAYKFFGFDIGVMTEKVRDYLCG